MSEVLHSPLGPSAAERWLNCPGSVLLTRDIPDHSSDFANEGTAAHTLSEWCRNEQTPAKHYKGMEINVKTEDGIKVFKIDAEMINKVQEFLNYVNQFGGDAFYELRAVFDHWVPGGFGTADDVRIQDGVCVVTDLKYGKGVQVYAEDNPQTKLYALGTYQQLRHLYDFDRFQLNIHQPRLDHIDEWEISLPELLVWAEDVVKPVAAIAMKPGAPIVPGVWCQFCKIKTTCKVRAEAVLETVVEDFVNLDAINGSEVLQSAVLTNDQMAHILPKLDMIKAWCTDLEVRAVREILQGHQVGDYKLVEGRSNRKWRDESNAEAALRECKLKVSEIFKSTLISPTEAEKLLGKKHPVIISQVIKPRGKPKLAPGSDKRPAMVISAEDEFADLDGEAGEE